MDTNTHTDTQTNGELPRAARADERPAERPAARGASTDGIWGIGQTADYLHLSVNAVYKMTAPSAALRMPHIRVGRRLRFRRADLDRWLELLTESNLNVLAKIRRAIR